MPESILIVEDEESIAESLGYNLKQEGYEVAFAYDGTEALLLARRLQPDLVLLDLLLPGVDGLAAGSGFSEPLA
ncbi:MAG: response regulator [Abditibacteriales bacterium]|nr:response regulator [Abditibacteriales bacterium]MDW8367600.1 response regulator [Abditibacteriales bacterium]